MARPSATPESRREHYGTRGRPLSDWEALKELWYGSERVRSACNDAFTRFEKHAYAEPASQRDDQGRELSQLIWAEMRAAGYEVSDRPVHFTRATPAPSQPTPAADAAAPPTAPPTPRPAVHSLADDPLPAPPRPAWIPVAVVAVVLVLLLLRRRRRR